MGALRKIVEQMGYKKVALKSHAEPAMLVLKVAVRRETEVEVVMQGAPAGDDQAIGLVENAVKQVQGQLRVLTDVL